MPITIDAFSNWVKLEESANMTWGLDTVRFRSGFSSLRIVQTNSGIIGRIFRSTTVQVGTFSAYLNVPANSLMNPGLGVWITSTNPSQVGGYLFEMLSANTPALWRIPHGSAITAWGQLHTGATLIASAPNAYPHPGPDVWVPAKISWAKNLATGKIRLRCFVGTPNGSVASASLFLDVVDQTPLTQSPLGVVHSLNNNAGTNFMNVDDSFIGFDVAA